MGQPLIENRFADRDDHWPEKDPEQPKALQSADSSHEGAKEIEPRSLGHQHRTSEFVTEEQHGEPNRTDDKRRS